LSLGQITIDERSNGPVIGIVCHGKVTATDYKKKLRPRFLATIKEYGTLRLVFLMRDDFKGWSSFYSFLEDMWTMLHVRRHLERVATVAHPSRLEWVANHSSHFIKGEARVFDPSDEEKAWEWAFEGLDVKTPDSS